MARHGMARHGMARHGTACRGVLHGMPSSGMAWHGMGLHRAAWPCSGMAGAILNLLHLLHAHPQADAGHAEPHAAGAL